MVKEKKIVCKREKVGEVWRYNCEGEKIVCVHGTEGKSGGASFAGFGGHGGEQHLTVKCFPKDEIKKALSKAIGKKPENIVIED